MTAPLPPRALVTDGLWRKSLSAVRSLGKAGFRVTVMGDSRFTTAFWSRYAARRVTAPTAKTDPAAFGAALLAELQRHPGAALLPMEDESLDWVSTHRDRLQPLARFLLPPAPSLRIAQDKTATVELAGRLGLPAPRTASPASPADLTRELAAFQPGTFVVRPRSGCGSAGVVYGDKQDESFWNAHWHRFGPLLLQERIPPQGHGLGASLLFDQHGRCVAAFAHERLQQYPNSGGPSTDRQSLQAPLLIEQSIRLLQHLQWRGVAMVEWKMDPRDQIPKLMEINPRFWGSLALAVRAGIDFPALYARAAFGESLGDPPAYPAHLRSRWMVPGEILRYLTQPRPQREPLRQFLRGLPQTAEEWDATDWRGTLSAIVCPAVQGLNPKYWRYLRR